MHLSKKYVGKSKNNDKRQKGDGLRAHFIFTHTCRVTDWGQGWSQSPSSTLRSAHCNFSPHLVFHTWKICLFLTFLSAYLPLSLFPFSSAEPSQLMSSCSSPSGCWRRSCHHSVSPTCPIQSVEPLSSSVGRYTTPARVCRSSDLTACTRL